MIKVSTRLYSKIGSCCIGRTRIGKRSLVKWIVVDYQEKIGYYKKVKKIIKGGRITTPTFLSV